MVYIYVIKLRENKFYIGKTDTPITRIETQLTSDKTLWTRKYHPIGLHELIPDCDPIDVDKYTLKYMYKYGLNNVRGGRFQETFLSSKDVQLINLLMQNHSLNYERIDYFIKNYSVIKQKLMYQNGSSPLPPLPQIPSSPSPIHQLTTSPVPSPTHHTSTQTIVKSQPPSVSPRIIKPIPIIPNHCPEPTFQCITRTGTQYLYEIIFDEVYHCKLPIRAAISLRINHQLSNTIHLNSSDYLQIISDLIGQQSENREAFISDYRISIEALNSFADTYTDNTNECNKIITRTMGKFIQNTLSITSPIVTANSFYTTDDLTESRIDELENYIDCMDDINNYVIVMVVIFCRHSFIGKFILN